MVTPWRRCSRDEFDEEPAILEEKGINSCQGKNIEGRITVL